MVPLPSLRLAGVRLANVSRALGRLGLIKSPGPEPDKVLSVLDLLGRQCGSGSGSSPGCTYSVSG